jgi:FecR protein
MVRSVDRRNCAVTGAGIRAAVILLFLAASAAAQQVGTVAEAVGTVQIGRAGTWAAAKTGAAVEAGDSLRTGRPGALQVVLADGSVLTMTEMTELRIDTVVLGSDRGHGQTLLHLLAGRMRAIVSEYYEQRGALFQIETATAIAGVRGTEFVIVFDPVAEVTDVVGVTGTAVVHSVLDRVGHEVLVTAQEMTMVTRGHYPTAPQRLSDKLFRQYMEGLEFIGAGRPESLSFAQPLATGAVVPEPDRAASLPGPAAAGGIGTVVNPTLQTRAPILSDEILPQQSRDASTLLENSPPVVEAPAGKVGVRF